MKENPVHRCQKQSFKLKNAALPCQSIVMLSSLPLSARSPNRPLHTTETTPFRHPRTTPHLPASLLHHRRPSSSRAPGCRYAQAACCSSGSLIAISFRLLPPPADDSGRRSFKLSSQSSYMTFFQTPRRLSSSWKTTSSLKCNGRHSLGCGIGDLLQILIRVPLKEEFHQQLGQLGVAETERALYERAFRLPTTPSNSTSHLTRGRRFCHLPPPQHIQLLLQRRRPRQPAAVLDRLQHLLQILPPHHELHPPILRRRHLAAGEPPYRLQDIIARRRFLTSSRSRESETSPRRRSLVLRKLRLHYRLLFSNSYVRLQLQFANNCKHFSAVSD
ncbi:PLAC8 family protein [Striga asiatica]|uniref:PLAC8 family protein n=1 Tax=Striga asiatica TaxID=4170 RepID=A0A5A7R1T3_STRAF|nr:PLAC8 family protein [Striga asiatica]